VACVKGEIIYTVKTETESFVLSAKDFSNLELMSTIEEAQNLEFGCDAPVKDFLAVLNYRPAADTGTKSRGSLTVITFVPKFFRLKSEEELKQAREVIIEDETTVEIDPQAEADRERQRREDMLDDIKQALRTPLAGETRAWDGGKNRMRQRLDYVSGQNRRARLKAQSQISARRKNRRVHARRRRNSVGLRRQASADSGRYHLSSERQGRRRGGRPRIRAEKL